MFKKILSVAALLGLVTLTSCEKQEETTNLEGVQAIKVSDFNQHGEIHNAFLSNAKDNFRIVESVTDEEEKIEIIYEFNKKFAGSLDISTSEKNLLIAHLNKTKDLVKTDNLSAKCFDNKETIFTMIQNLRTNGIINNDSYEILNSLSHDVKANYENRLTDDKLKENVLNLIQKFDNIGYSKNSEGEMVGTILAISIASLEWWEENPDAFLYDSNARMIAPLVWADVAGGLLNGGGSVAVQYGVNERVNWEIVGWSALLGAVNGSTGMIGKVGRFFSKL